MTSAKKRPSGASALGPSTRPSRPRRRRTRNRSSRDQREIQPRPPRGTSTLLSASTFLIYQDLWNAPQEQAEPRDDSSAARPDPAIVFYELANADSVGYRIVPHQASRKHDDNATKNTVLLRIRQEQPPPDQAHTGGLVWETSYLLLEYFRYCTIKNNGSSAPLALGHVLEVGAGCGLLGLGLACLVTDVPRATAVCQSVTLTETPQVLVNLQHNVSRNTPHLPRHAVVRACALDWTCYVEDVAHAGIVPHSIDTVVGTDVLFAPHLVRPLWDTLSYLCHPASTIYLCVQIRCERSHALFLTRADELGCTVENLVPSLTDAPSLDHAPALIWGAALDCQLLRLQWRR